THPTVPLPRHRAPESRAPPITRRVFIDPLGLLVYKGPRQPPMAPHDPNALLALVSGIARRLQAATDPDALDGALAEVARSLVPGAADLCLIDLATSEQRELRLAAVGHPDPAVEAQVREARARLAP